MSLLDDITLLCEGDDGGLDVRLLEAARIAARTRSRLAERVTIRPAGSKLDLRPTLRRERRRDARARVYAIRDRDALTRDLVEAQRREAFRSDEQQCPWPLSRRCIESYLVDPSFLGDALGPRDWAETLGRLASDRLWGDLVRGAHEDVAWQVRQVRPESPDLAALRSLDEAAAALDAIVARYGAKVQGVLTADGARERLARLEADVRADGPSWARVDGKALLRDLEAALKAEGAAPPGGLLNRLRAHAERSAPAALVDELTDLLTALDAA